MLITKLIPTACSFLQEIPGEKYEKKADVKILQDTDISFAINAEHPYAFVFAPNGDFARDVKDGGKLSIAKNNAHSWTSLYIQFNNDLPTEKMVAATKDYGMPLPSFAIKDNVVTTFFYVFEKPMLRVDLTSFLEYIHWDLAPFGANTDGISVTKEFSMPGSWDWRGQKQQVELLGFAINGGVTEFNAHMFGTMPEAHFNKLWNAYRERVAYSAGVRKKYSSILNETRLNQLDIKELIKAEWYVLQSDGFRLATNKEIQTFDHMWINPKTNTLVIGLLKKGPHGTILEYVHELCEKSHVLVNKYMQEHFWFPILEDSVFQAPADKKDITITGDKEMIVFTDKVIKIQYVKTDGSLGQTVIFKQIFEVLGKGYVTIDKGFGGELKNPEIVIVIKKDGQIHTLSVITNPSKFNTTYNNIGLFFYGTDNHLKVFFQTLIESPDVTELNLIEKSWYYDDACVLGNKAVRGDIWTGCMITNDANIYKWDKKEVSVQEFFTEMKKVWKDDIAAIALLQTAALHGMNLWQNMRVYPCLWVSAWYKVGKSTLMDCCQSFVGYSTTPVAMNSITPQPLSLMGCDNAIIFGEEFTNIKNPMIENIFRNIINRIQWWRWFGAKNIIYSFKANIFAAGESLPESPSLQSRFVAIRLKRASRVKDSNQYILETIRRMTCCQELSKTYIERRAELTGIYHVKRDLVYKHCGDARMADVWAYTFTMRELFPIVTETELLEYMKTQVTNMGADDHEKESQKATLKLQKCIMNAYMARKVSITITNTVNNNAQAQLVIQFENTYYQQHKWEIIEIIQDLKQEWYENFSTDGALIRMVYPVEGTAQNQVDIDLFYMVEYVKKSTNTIREATVEAFD